jgi:hypothetical protein
MTSESSSFQDPDITKALEHLNSVLVSGEVLDSWAFQLKIFALTHRRILIAATSGRLITIKRGILGGFEMSDFRWQDLGDVKIRVGIFGADITMKIYSSTDLALSNSLNRNLIIEGLDKDQAQKIYRFAQEQEQSWREKRRQRELEELKAKSGVINLGNNSAIHPTGAEDATSKLLQAKQMLDNKLITDTEYESIKARIINGL